MLAAAAVVARLDAPAEALQPAGASTHQRRRARLESDVLEPYTLTHQRRIHSLTGQRLHMHAKYTCPKQEREPDVSMAVCDGHPVTPTCGAVRSVGGRNRNGRPVLYTHLHKAGGTCMCQLAKLNKETFARGSVNCNIDPEDNWAPVAHDVAVTCARRTQLTLYEGLTWMAQERWVDPEPCDQLYHAITMRDPLDRMISNLLHTRYRAEMGRKRGFSTASLNVSAESVMDCILPNASCWHPKYYVEMSTAAYDNFYVRTLAGPEAFFLPAGALTSQHLTTAKVVLRRYDVIMMLEQFEEDSVQMQGLLGWTVTRGPEVAAANANTRSDHWEAVGMPSDDAVPFSTEQLHTLLRVNKLDYELLCYAKALREERIAAARLTLPVRPFANASAVAADCRARKVCACKIFGKCGKKYDGTTYTTDPDERFPLHHSSYYCRVFGLCGDDLPQHLRGADWKPVGAPAWWGANPGNVSSRQ